jgi:hypothetical protein
MAKILQKLKTSKPAELAAKAHQEFVRLPYEANPEAMKAELARTLHALKASRATLPPHRCVHTPAHTHTFSLYLSLCCLHLLPLVMLPYLSLHAS